MRRLCLILTCVLFVGCSSQNNNLSTPIVPDVGAPSDLGDVVASDDTSGASAATSVPTAGEAELTPVAIVAGVAALSAENTTIQFVGTHVAADPNPRTGVFNSFTGTAAVDAESRGLKSVSIEIQTDSLETPIPNLNNHLKTPDFFDVNEFPTARFESTSITPIDGDADRYSVTGNLTLLDSTQKINFPATVTTSEEGLTLTGELVIDRTEFGMDGVQNRVNKEIALSFAIGRKTETPEGGLEIGGGGRGGGGPRGGGRRRFDPAAIFQQQDADGDGKLTGDEIAGRMRDNLSEIDTDGDGAISLEELKERFRQFRGRGPGGGQRGEGRGPDATGRPPRPE